MALRGGSSVLQLGIETRYHGLNVGNNRLLRVQCALLGARIQGIQPLQRGLGSIPDSTRQKRNHAQDDLDCPDSRLLDTFPHVDERLFDIIPCLTPMPLQDIDADEDDTGEHRPGNLDGRGDDIPYALKYGRDLRPVRAYEVHDGEDGRPQAVP